MVKLRINCRAVVCETFFQPGSKAFVSFIVEKDPFSKRIYPLKSEPLKG